MTLAGSAEFAIVPVVDLRGGLVVRARAGDRERYAPISTPLSPVADPVAVVTGLLAAVPSPRIYVADLDAIEGRGDHRAAIAAIARAHPSVELWIDAGFSSESQVRRFAALGVGRPVLGSESQRDDHLLRTMRDCVLSLDYRGEEALGPAAIHDDPSLWPRQVIVMTLSRIGLADGPDWERLRAVKAAAADRAIFAAGGVRGVEDCLALHRLGIAGALVASAIHDGRLRGPVRGDQDQGEA
jgi:phosphoribosylformimino-5-aminoimidazole carboxamide ribotide isomerase